MIRDPLDRPLLIVVGSGGVGKTTVAAALGVHQALAGARTLVMTFDPSLRLKDALGVGEEAREHEVTVDLSTVSGAGTPSAGTPSAGTLDASLLDARLTFDRLVARYAPEPAERDRILGNPFYDRLSGTLAGILEYMAVERLFEVAAEGHYDRIILDTPPTRQALDFLEAPDRIIAFLDSGILKIATRDWFDADGRFKPTARWGFLGRGVEHYLDELVGLDLLREMGEFFQAFGPLYAGFRQRAEEVKALLRSPRTGFLLVSGPGEQRIPDTLFFARRLKEEGYPLGPLVVNRIHPRLATPPDPHHPDRGREGRRLLAWLGEHDHQGIARLSELLAPDQPLVRLPLLPDEPTALAALAEIGADVAGQLRSAPLPGASAPRSPR